MPYLVKERCNNGKLVRSDANECQVALKTTINRQQHEKGKRKKKEIKKKEKEQLVFQNDHKRESDKTNA